MAQVMGNVIVGQSGGPTAVINSSLAGVYKTARDRGAKKVFGMLHGVQGLLEERVVDLSQHIRSDLDIDLLKRTPSSFLGSCRFKLPEIKDDQAVYDKIFAILDKLEIEYFFYIGGNDSMDTIKKLSDYAILNGSRIRFMGVPKTIDNDLAVTDHTPGFGSAAKYIASITKEVIRDGLVYDQQNVTLVEIMGRNAGWLTGAAALAKGEDCEGPDMLFLPGGPGTPNLAAHEGVVQAVLKFNEDGKNIAAICAAPGVLGQLGVLKGKKATCFPGYEDKLQGAEYVREKAVTDGNITTARGMGASIELGLELIRILADKEKSDEIAGKIQFL